MKKEEQIWGMLTTHGTVIFVRTVEEPGGGIRLVICIAISWEHSLPPLKFGN